MIYTAMQALMKTGVLKSLFLYIGCEQTHTDKRISESGWLFMMCHVLPRIIFIPAHSQLAVRYQLEDKTGMKQK